MYMKVLSVSLMLAIVGGLSGANATELAEHEVEIRGPSSLTNTADTQPQAVMPRANANIKVDENGQVVVTSNSPKPVCQKVKYPDDIVVPTAKFKKVDLTEFANTITVNAEETALKLVNRARPEAADSLDEHQILAAIYRANPSSFNNSGPMAGMEIKVPSVARIELEEKKVGIEIAKSIAGGTLKKYALPQLVLPWVQEEEEIKKAQEAKDKRDQTVKLIDEKYQACLDEQKALAEEKKRAAEALEEAKKKAEEQKITDAKTEIALDDPDMMIQDENISVNAEGKTVIKITDTSRQQKPKDETETATPADTDTTNQTGIISGNTLSFSKNGVFAEGGKSSTKSAHTPAHAKPNANSQEIKQLISSFEQTIAEQKEQIDKLNQENAQSMQALLTEIKSLKAEKQAYSEQTPKQSDDSHSVLLIVLTTLCSVFLLILLLGGALLFFLMKRTNLLASFIKEKATKEDNKQQDVSDNALASTSLQNTADVVAEPEVEPVVEDKPVTLPVDTYSNVDLDLEK